MANRTLEYLGVLQNYFSGIDYDQALFDADDGSHSTVADGKKKALAEIDSQLEDLKQLRDDVVKLPLNKLQEKYDH